MPTRRHDLFLKQLYREGIQDAVSLFLPDLASQIDWTSLEWIDKEIIIPRPQPRSLLVDLVGRTRDTGGRDLRLLIHPELQMTLDVEMGWRVLQYIAGLVLKEGNPNTRVVTIVFYHCRGSGGIRFEWYPMMFGGYTQLGAGYFAVGLGELEAEQYARGENPMGWALASWMSHEKRRRPELKLRLLEKILSQVKDGRYQELLTDAVWTYLKLDKKERAKEEKLLATREYDEVNEMFQTKMQKLKADAIREGLQEGRQTGRQETLQKVLISLLRSRFESMPEEIETQIRRMSDAEMLEALILRVSSAATPEELLRSSSLNATP